MIDRSRPLKPFELLTRVLIAGWIAVMLSAGAVLGQVSETGKESAPDSIQRQSLEIPIGGEVWSRLGWPGASIPGPITARWTWHDRKPQGLRVELWDPRDGVWRSEVELQRAGEYHELLLGAGAKERFDGPLRGELTLMAAAAPPNAGNSALTREVKIPFSLRPGSSTSPTWMPWWFLLGTFIAAYAAQEVILQLRRQSTLRAAEVGAKFRRLRSSGTGGLPVEEGRGRGDGRYGGEVQDAVRRALRRRLWVRCKTLVRQPARFLLGRPYAEMVRITVPSRGTVSADLVEDLGIRRALEGEASAASRLLGEDALFVVAESRGTARIYWVSRHADSFMGWRVRGKVPPPGVVRPLGRDVELVRDPDDSFGADEHIGWRIKPHAAGVSSRRR